MSPTRFPHGVSSQGASINPQSGLFSGKGVSFYCDPTNGLDGNDGLTPQNAVKTIAEGYSRLTANRHDTLFLIGTTAMTNLAAKLTWAKDYCHLIGVAAPTWMNQRARIGHSANFSPGIEITASGCLFQNIYFSYGRGAAGNLIACKISGSRNVFDNVHIAGPMHATEGGQAGFISLNLSGAQECSFYHSTFGITTIPRTAASAQIVFDTSVGRCLFEDCFVLSASSSAATPVMLKNAAVDGIVDFVLFKKCQFLNFSANWAQPLTAGITNAGGNSGGIVLHDCMFTGITDIGAAGNLLRTFVLGNDGASATTSLALTPTTS